VKPPQKRTLNQVLVNHGKEHAICLKRIGSKIFPLPYLLIISLLTFIS
jgi:hypothetical protein